MRLATRKYVEEFLRALESPHGPGGLPFLAAARLALHALMIGSLLSIVTGWLHHSFNGNGNGKSSVPGKAVLENDALIASSSVVFICVGMTGVMILIEDNLARAFAIGAAIALVRFRVKMAGKFLGIAMLYGVLTGMACGVGRIDIAWGLAALFMLLLSALLLVRNQLRRPPPV